MFLPREDGLGTVFLPFHIGALAAAVLLTCAGHAAGPAAAAVFIGWYIASFTALMLLFYVAVYLFCLTIDMSEPPKEDHPHVRRLVLIIISHLCRFGRLRLHLRGGELLPEGRFLLVSNHRSNYDPMASVWALRKRDIGFITKPENLRIPIAGPLIFRANYLPIDRTNPREALKTIAAASDLLRRDVVSIGVYPEGTRSRSGEMLPFHNGVFKIAQKVPVPVVVMSVRGTEDIAKNAPLRRTEVYMDVCAVIPAEEAASLSTAEMSERVRSLLEASLGNAE